MRRLSVLFRTVVLTLTALPVAAVNQPNELTIIFVVPFRGRCRIDGPRGQRYGRESLGSPTRQTATCCRLWTSRAIGYAMSSGIPFATGNTMQTVFLGATWARC